MTTHRARTVLSLAAVAAVVAGGTATAAPGGSDVYVALGDSYSSGYGISPQTRSGFCGRSAVNYPSLIARELGIDTVRDVTCAAARSADFSSPQQGRGGSAAPQYDALSEDTTLVTVGIGGNDIGLVELATRCIALPLTTPCSTAPGDTYAERIDAFAATYDAVFDEIAHRSPHARIVTVGYPTGIRPGGCPDRQPIRPEDATYLQARVDQLDTVMATTAQAHGATYVDVAESTRDHDACADDSWMVGVVPTSPDAYVPFHPTAAGHANTARHILSALN